MRKPRAYRLVCLSEEQVVYECLQDDGGCAHEDSLSTGTPHMSVTTDPEGGYPYFTCPTFELKAISSN
jgi:hypothetical protein